MTSYAEVIGDPIDHSRSPLIHQFWLDQLGIDARYGRRRVPRADLADYVAQRRADVDWKGSNVTMPLKLDALGLADDATDRAVAAGAANVLLPRDGKIVAANTDVGAIADILARLQRDGASMAGVTLLGNGGAARAALVALKLVGLTAVRIQARDMAAAMKLAVEFGLDVQPAPMDAPIGGSGVINATPLGMNGMDCLDCDLSQLPTSGWVFDMITDPVETPLVQQARRRGLKVANGLDMLVGQAATSFKLFFGVDAPRDRDAILWQKLQA
ncbi:shikimate dehydrogenase family protein [Sphingomonas jaspsi]|uniref:shikimate dehydrogenase family protein n=1 Tax=Sphingomonas jaspsi TaxID=392409 RepID=UPI0004B116A1|nr:shikimate dehydrogenase [Sphingomonas jaspsi]